VSLNSELAFAEGSSWHNNMVSLADSIRRRISSNASTVIMAEPDSPGADGRRPTISRPIPLFTNGMMAPLDSHAIDTSPRQSVHSAAASSTYVLAPEWAADPEYRPFPTMATICQEEGLFYPLERQGQDRYIEDVGGYSGPVHRSVDVIETVTELPPVCGTVTEYKEPALSKMTRRVSNVGRQARKLSDELGRKASKLLHRNNAPNVVRNKQRDGFDLEEEWQMTGQVDLGREVEEDDSQWRRNIEQDFRVVEWNATA
jgi:hypothetical protein